MRRLQSILSDAVTKYKGIKAHLRFPESELLNMAELLYTITTPNYRVKCKGTHPRMWGSDLVA
jgi:hypothetical protein